MIKWIKTKIRNRIEYNKKRAIQRVVYNSTHKFEYTVTDVNDNEIHNEVFDVFVYCFENGVRERWTKITTNASDEYFERYSNGRNKSRSQILAERKDILLSKIPEYHNFIYMWLNGNNVEEIPTICEMFDNELMLAIKRDY